MPEIATTHVGSLPRPGAVADLLFAQESGVPLDPGGSDRLLSDTVNAVVARQKQIGISLPSDGEMSKISYGTYIKYRLSGFSGDSPRIPPADLERYPDFLRKLAASGGTPTYSRPRCTGPVAMQNRQPLEDDIRRMTAAMAAAGYNRGFMNSASPGILALFQPNDFYPREDDYLEAVAAAMRAEYLAITRAGLILQLDSPDLALGRHTMYKSLDDAAFVNRAARHVEVLNHALRDIPPEQIRLHVCWGNYEGPHVCDIPLEQIMPQLLRIRASAFLFEAANPRHAHEWTVWRDADLPEDLTLIPGVIDTTTNYVEHPELVAERIARYVNLVGPERVIAGTDCGFATFAGYGAVNGEIAWEKLQSLTRGAEIATVQCLD